MIIVALKFESSVNSDGTQTINWSLDVLVAFESSVNSDGTQTLPNRAYRLIWV